MKWIYGISYIHFTSFLSTAILRTLSRLANSVGNSKATVKKRLWVRIPLKPEFFRLYFLNYSSWAHKCDDLSFAKDDDDYDDDDDNDDNDDDDDDDDDDDKK